MSGARRLTRATRLAEAGHHPPLVLQVVPISDLRPAPYNPRRIDPAAMTALEKSLQRFGYVEPIVWNRRSGYVVGGHQRLKVLRRQKVPNVHVVVVDLDDEHERQLNVTLNNPAVMGTFVPEKLLEMLAGLRAADGQAFRDLRMDALEQNASLARAFRDPDDAPPRTAETTTKVGDVYELGRHRLVCGDATDQVAVTRLLAGDRVDQLLTDPPYGVDLGEKTASIARRQGRRAKHEPITNDVGLEYRSWFASWLKLIPWSDPATLYVFMSSMESHNLRLALADVGYAWGEWLLWLKNRPVLARKDYNSRYELIAFGGPQPAPDCEDFVGFAWPRRHRFYGGSKRTNVLEYDSPARSDLHPTMKPVALLEQLLRDGSTGGGVVLDLFGGSGSTLIAAEIVGRRGRVLELDPGYCDVIVRRWEEFTDQKAVRGRA
jgi:DNA modification methylase